MQLTAQSNLPSTRMLVLLDTILVALFAVLLLAAAPWLADAMDLPVNFLRGAGAILVPWTAYLVITLNQAHISKRALLSIFLVNEAWVLASLGILASGAVDPNGFGVGFLLFQSAGVFVLATFQYLRLRTQN